MATTKVSNERIGRRPATESQAKSTSLTVARTKRATIANVYMVVPPATGSWARAESSTRVVPPGLRGFQNAVHRPNEVPRAFVLHHPDLHPVHHVAEADAMLGIGEPERSARA